MPDDEAREHAWSRISRRQFLKGAGSGLVGSALAPVAAGTNERRDAPRTFPEHVGPGPMPLSLIVNGQEMHLSVEPRTTLLEALRGPGCACTGVKEGCGRGECGACTVLLEGKPVLACLMLAIEAEGASVSTIESLPARDGKPHPIQDAFAAEGAGCNRCAPGLILSTKAVLDRNPGAGDAELQAALSGHACHCGTQARALDAARRAAGRAGQKTTDYRPQTTDPEPAVATAPQPLVPSPTGPASPAVGPESPAQGLGSRVSGPGSPAQGPGSVVCGLWSSPWPAPWDRRVLGKRIAPFEGADRAAGRARGTGDVSLAGMLHGAILRCPFPHARVTSLNVEGAAGVRGVRAAVALVEPGAELSPSGREVAAVAAGDPETARAALRRADVRYEPLAFSVDPSAAIEQVLEVASQGNVGAAFARAGLATVEAEYRTAPLPDPVPEPVVVAHWEAPDRLKVWAPAADIHGLRAEVAGGLGIGISQVEVSCEAPAPGGSDAGILPAVVAAARLARDAGAPVRIALDCGDALAAAGTLPGVAGKVKVAADRDGRLAGIRIQARVFPAAASPEPGMELPHRYGCADYRVECTGLRADVPGPSGSWLAGAGFLVECALDELAGSLGLDPVELRKRNETNEARRQAYDLGAERIQWEQRNPFPGAGAGMKRRGMGVAACVRRDPAAPGALAALNVHRDGSIELCCAVGDPAPGARTALACIVAEELGITPGDVGVSIGRTPLGPGPVGPGAWSPSSAAAPVKRAAAEARALLLDAAAAALGVEAGSLGAASGKVYLRDDPGRSLTWKQVCALLPAEGVCALGRWADGIAGGDAAGVHFAEVEVDLETGGIAVSRVVAVYDCGVMVDALAAQTRIEAAVMAGVGQALSAERVWDRPNGLPVNAAPGGSLAPGFPETPVIDVLFVGRPDAAMAADPGDAPLMATAAAIANAVYNASGARIRTLPLARGGFLTALAGR